MDEAEFCNQVLLLANRLVAVGKPGDVLTNKNLQRGIRPPDGSRR